MTHPNGARLHLHAPWWKWRKVQKAIFETPHGTYYRIPDDWLTDLPDLGEKFHTLLESPSWEEAVTLLRAEGVQPA